MKKITYPFVLHGQISVHFKHSVRPIFFETHENTADIPMAQFVVDTFQYDSEHQMLSISLQKAINTEGMDRDVDVFSGKELSNHVIKLDIQYCLHNACILSSKISYPLADDSCIDSIKVTKPLTIVLK